MWPKIKNSKKLFRVQFPYFLSEFWKKQAYIRSCKRMAKDADMTKFSEEDLDEFITQF